MGLNLQMLIYLLAIKNSHSFTDKNDSIRTLYYPALLKESKSSRGLTLEEKKKCL